jgi:N-acylneuraminate cytidylyltransferase
MNVLALIPARGNSKTLPGKNLRVLAGKPLLAWSIAAALESRFVSRVVVSSDDDAILTAAAIHGAEPLRRPAELATDAALTDPVIDHALSELGRKIECCGGPSSGEDFDLVVLLQPTSPVRAPGLVDACISRLLDARADSLVTAYPLHFVWWREEQFVPWPSPGPRVWRSQCPRRPRRQDLAPQERMFHEDGSVFVVRADMFRAVGSKRVVGRVEVFETERAPDIDTGEDFAMAEALLLYRQAMARRPAEANVCAS